MALYGSVVGSGLPLAGDIVLGKDTVPRWAGGAESCRLAAHGTPADKGGVLIPVGREGTS